MPLEYTVDGHVATFTIRNGTVNQMTPKIHKELYHAMHEFLSDDNIRVGILTGAGDRAFSAGDDIRTPYVKFDSPREELEYYMVPRHRVKEGDPESFLWSRDVLAIERLKPIVAAVNGYCLGQAMIYLLHLTDIRVASTDAKFGFPEIAYGMGGAGGSTRLGRHIPPVLAMEMLLTGDAMDAEQALRANLVNAVVPKGEVMAKAQDYAQRIARHEPLGVRVEMDAMLRTQDMDRRAALDYVKTLYRMQRMAFSGEERVGKFLYKDK